MIIAATNKDKLFVQFDRIVKYGWIHLWDDNKFDLEKELKETEFEIIVIPKTAPLIYLEVKIEGEKKVKKVIYHYE